MRMLIIDDEEDIVTYLKEAALAEGVEEVDTVQSGEEALGRVIKGEYDLITLDICMPGISGLDIVPVVRNLCPHAVMALISGHIPAEIDEDILDNIDVLINKPVSLDSFFQLLDATRSIFEARKRIAALGVPSETDRPKVNAIH